ncbi:hypothetical protein SRHO_G00005820 [Serrasalmus rhombeus]
MPVVGVASKLRPPLAGARPIHTALPIPNPAAQRSGGRGQGSNCQLSIKTELQESSKREAEERKICKWATVTSG